MKIAELKLTDPIQKEEKPLYYLAYGMNTDPRVMSVHEYCKPIGGVILDGHKLSFAQFADIIPTPGKRMGCALWEIDKITLASLDAQEGYPTMYTRKIVTVTCKGQPYKAIVYQMTKSNREYFDGYSPSKGYIKNLVAGYQAFGIPIEQIKQALRDEQLTVEGFEPGNEIL
jgi:gamma-glutamylcyclotransferase (GGCT)/AIG2-like uncharacterized protein YtfP